MNAQGEPILVGWKVATLASNMASPRYRAVLPMIALEGSGVRCRLFQSGLERNLDGLDVLVIVKSFNEEDLRLAQLAAAQGIPVVLDLCDNIFIGDYASEFIGDYASESNGMSPAQMFLGIAELASCVVVTTEPLADVVRSHLPDARIAIIPDGIESAALGGQMLQVLRDAAAFEKAQKLDLLRQRARNLARRVRVEGIGVILALVAFAVRHGGRALARRVRSGLHARLRRKPVAQVSPGVVASAPEQRPSARKILWFGNHGAEHARFGMLDILEFRGALEAIAAEHDVELVVISNNRQKYEGQIAPLSIPSRYVEWSQRAVTQWLAQADAVIVPNTLDSFSLCKSANRTVLALANGVPVVATPTPALSQLAEYIFTGDPLAALRDIFSEPGKARALALEGHRQAEALYGLQSIRAQWLQVLRDVPGAANPRPASAPWMVVVLHLVQDLDLVLPILRDACASGLSCEAWCSGTLFSKSARVFAALKEERVPVRILPNERRLRDLVFPSATQVLLTVAETNLGPHRIPRMLTETAKRQGLFVATMQHGFENVGLTYDDALQRLDKVDIAAHRIYIWGPMHTLHPRIRDDVRVRCVPVGCPKDARVPAADLHGLVPQGRPVVGIFENLHWHRYSDAYRQAFLDNVATLSREFREVLFLVKPHHAGLWLTRRYDGERPVESNLLIADPQLPRWEPHTASALLPHLAAVITSPSTVALDAARLQIPVAVVAGGLPLDNYRPLTLLNTRDDWRGFVAQALDAGGRPALEAQSLRFVDAVLTPGDAARRIVEDLRAAVAA